MCVHITKVAIGEEEGIFRAEAWSILEMNFYFFGLLWCLRPLELAGLEREELRPCSLQNSWEHLSGTFWGLGLGILRDSACVSVHNEQLSPGAW